jgi:hypothetical protein
MSTNRNSQDRQPIGIDELRADLAAFHLEMHEHSLHPESPYKAFIPFALGAVMALAICALVALLPHSA